MYSRGPLAVATRRRFASRCSATFIAATSGRPQLSSGANRRPRPAGISPSSHDDGLSQDPELEREMVERLTVDTDDAVEACEAADLGGGDPYGELGIHANPILKEHFANSGIGLACSDSGRR